MPRSKVKLAFIEDNKARKSSFMKRKESLKSKLRELTILCRVEACVILYGPYEPELELWPEDNNAFQSVLNLFLSKPPIERSKYMLNQDSYIRERMNKAKEQINKHTTANREIVIAKLMSDCFSGKVSLANLNLTDLNEIVSYGGGRVSEIVEKIEALKIKTPAAEGGQTPPPPPPPPSELPPPQEVVGGNNTASASKIAAEGGADEDVYVPVMGNPGGFDEQTTEWYPPDWINSELDLVPGIDMKTFSDGLNPFWPDDPKSG